MSTLAQAIRHNICFRNRFSLFLQQLVRLDDKLWKVRLPDVPAPSSAPDFVLACAFLLSPFQDAAQRLLFYRADQCSRNSYVDDNSCLIGE
jgi:hypothetical protein